MCHGNSGKNFFFSTRRSGRGKQPDEKGKKAVKQSGYFLMGSRIYIHYFCSLYFREKIHVCPFLFGKNICLFHFYLFILFFIYKREEGEASIPHLRICEKIIFLIFFEKHFVKKRTGFEFSVNGRHLLITLGMRITNLTSKILKLMKVVVPFFKNKNNTFSDENVTKHNKK